MREIDRILDKIESCIRESTYYPVETDRIEVKDVTSGEDWTEVYKSACAFLNANGGILIIGIKEKNKNYQLTGFNPDNEEKIKELAKKFTNEDQKPLDLQGYFPSIEIKEMLDKRVCLVFVEKLPEEMKYVYYNK
ncbi:MAG: ATP-binding protein [Saprospiraceae bacterium]|nr:ATP-binding protein [Saprospiraceae bacterium]